MRLTTFLTILATTAVLAGCGGESADLFAVERSGDVPGAKLTLVVNDAGWISCNGGKDIRMPDQLLLDAREIARELLQPADEGLTLKPGPQSVLQYQVRMEEGNVRFADTSPGAPAVTRQLAFFVRQSAQDVCGLER